MMRISGAVVAAMVLLLPASALATGTVHILQSDGSAQTYADVVMKVREHTLTMTSADRVSTMTIRTDGDGCAPANGLVYCTGASMSLQHSGKASVIPLKAAKFFFNLSDEEQSSDTVASVFNGAGCQASSKVGPHTVVFALLTGKGTHITGNGKLE